MESPLSELSKRYLTARIRRMDCIAAVLFIILSIYLYQPSIGPSKATLLLYNLNLFLAALGTYLLSKRWVNNWTPSVFAGAIYGFGPFALSFKTFHPVAGLSFAIVPWLLLPAVYWHKQKAANASRFSTRALFTLLPFVGVVLLFWIPSQEWIGPFFLMPQQLALTVEDFTNLILPLHKAGGLIVFGLYHCSLIFALMGIFICIKLQRVALLTPIAIGLILAFLNPVLQVTPIVWAAFPMVFLSVLCGLGFQAFLYAGKADTKWVLTCAAAATALAAFSAGIMITPFAGKVFELSAVMYAFTAAALWLLLALIRLNLRWPYFKWAILTSAITIDLLYSASYLINKF